MSIFTRTLRQTIFVSLIYFFTISSISEAQNINTDKYQYLSPVPGSKLNSNETTIIIRFGDPFENYGLENGLVVRGNKSGLHKGKIIFAENNRTLIFKPNNQFADEEVITVELNNNLRTVSNELIPALQYSFETSKINLNKNIISDPNKYFELLDSDFKIDKKLPLQKNLSSQEIFNRKSYTIQHDSLPDDFPDIAIDSINNPTPGYIFFTPFGMPNFLSNYLIITDNYGTPIFFRKMKSATFDFKKVNDSTLAYFDYGKVFQHYLLNSSYDIIDSVSLQNGYPTDLHEFLLLDNKHTLQLCYDYEKVRMDTIVAGGDSNATVIGIIIQEQDENKNVVFQWRSWDHYKITDATYDINLTDSLIDYAHSNAIEIDYDGNILLSTRHLDEITKINRTTGDIIWRLGGEYCKNNQFTFLNDPIGFSHQHDVRRLPNGNITLFDNGNLHSPQFTRIAEYQIDEENKLVSLVWEYRNDPETYSGAMGSAERLDNHNTFIGWGFSASPSISEVGADKSVKFYLTLPDTLLNYRAFKFPWKTNLFVTEPEDLYFGYVPAGDSLIKPLKIINNSDRQIEINGLLNRDSAFTVVTPLPIIIDAFKDSTIQVKFKPTTAETYSDEMYLQWNHDNERITQIVPMAGTIISSAEYSGKKLDYTLGQNYPNPFNPSTIIKYSVPELSKVKLTVYNLLGEEVTTLVDGEKIAGNYSVQFNANLLSSGVYFYRLQAGNFIETKKMILLK